MVDDEQDIADILQFNLRAKGYDVDVAFSAEEALQHLSPALPARGGGMKVTSSFDKSNNSSLSPCGEGRAGGYDLILLDVMMGEISGFGLARLLKKDVATAGIPIIFITALDGEEETVKGLDIGADDYIAKTLSMKEVKARVRAVLRRSSVPFPAIPSRGSAVWKTAHLTFEGIVIDFELKSAAVDGKAMTLTHLEFELLAFFLQHQGASISATNSSAASGRRTRSCSKGRSM